MPNELERLEEALAELTTLLDDPSAPEPALQAWFERHPCVFRALGYDAAIPHPHLGKGAGLLIPDFLCRRPNGVWEIVELKLPGQRLVRSRDSRARFYDPVDEYLAQCAEYARHFRQEDMRAEFNQTNGVSVQAEVKSILVVGTPDPSEGVTAHNMLAERGDRTTIQTYPDLVANLALARTGLAVHNEGGAGLSVHAVVVLPPKIDAPIILTHLGCRETSDRIALKVLPPGILELAILDSDGQRHVVSLSKQAAGWMPGIPTAIAFQFGLSESGAVLSLEVDGLTKATRLFDRFDLHLSAERDWIWGLDPFTRESGTFVWISGCVFDRVLDFSSRLALLEDMALKEHRRAAENLTPMNYVLFHPQSFIIAMHHALLDSVSGLEPVQKYGAALPPWR